MNATEQQIGSENNVISEDLLKIFELYDENFFQEKNGKKISENDTHISDISTQVENIKEEVFVDDFQLIIKRFYKKDSIKTQNSEVLA